MKTCEASAAKVSPVVATPPDTKAVAVNGNLEFSYCQVGIEFASEYAAAAKDLPDHRGFQGSLEEPVSAYFDAVTRRKPDDIERLKSYRYAIGRLAFD